MSPGLLIGAIDVDREQLVTRLPAGKGNLGSVGRKLRIQTGSDPLQARTVGIDDIDIAAAPGLKDNLAGAVAFNRSYIVWCRRAG